MLTPTHFPTTVEEAVEVAERRWSEATFGAAFAADRTPNPRELVFFLLTQLFGSEADRKELQSKLHKTRDELHALKNEEWYARQVEPDLYRANLNFQCAELSIKTRYGDESQQYARFTEAAAALERLIESVPGLRDKILRGLINITTPA